MCADNVLLQQLQSVSSMEEVERVISDNIDIIGESSDVSFSRYIHEKIEENNIPISEVISNSHINKNYVYNILNGKKTHPGRDKIIALCIGAGMSIEQLNTALCICGFSRLNPVMPRDIYITYFINTRLKDVMKLQLILEEREIKPLDI